MIKLITIKINTDNDAFNSENYGNEVSNILQKIADDYRLRFYPAKTYRDMNGNSVCTVEDTQNG